MTISRMFSVSVNRKDGSVMTTENYLAFTEAHRVMQNLAMTYDPSHKIIISDGYGRVMTTFGVQPP